MTNYLINITLSNGIEIHFEKEAESKEVLFDQINQGNTWYEHEENDIRQYFKTDHVVSIKIRKKDNNKPAGFDF